MMQTGYWWQLFPLDLITLRIEEGSNHHLWNAWCDSLIAIKLWLLIRQSFCSFFICFLIRPLHPIQSVASIVPAVLAKLTMRTAKNWRYSMALIWNYKWNVSRRWAGVLSLTWIDNNQANSFIRCRSKCYSPNRKWSPAQTTISRCSSANRNARKRCG